jgi:D-alanyl-lipoteichoic acid acyltransferase DltB (MBOAT superfamily)
MLLGGLWHGASWLFVLWGGAHGLLLILERLAQRLFGGLPVFATPTAKFLIGLLTFLLVCLTWVLFRANSLEAAEDLFAVMLQPAAGLAVTNVSPVVTVLGLLAARVGMHWFMREREFDSMLKSLSWQAIGAILAAMIIAILLSPGEERDFIYFEF